MLIAAEKIRELSEGQDVLLMFIGVAFILAVTAVAMWEDGRSHKNELDTTITVGQRLANLKATSPQNPSIAFIEKIHALGGDQDYTDRLLRAEGF